MYMIYYFQAMRKSKKMKKHEDMAELCKKSVSACKRVLAVLRAAFPAEYVRCSAVQGRIQWALLRGFVDFDLEMTFVRMMLTLK